MYMLLEFMFLCRKINQSRLPQDLEKCRISHETQEDNSTMKKESNGIYSQSQRNMHFSTGMQHVLVFGSMVCEKKSSYIGMSLDYLLSRFRV
jgi:hypothetical protein